MQRINNIELKFICVEILSEIDRVCAKYGLHYFANFGTLIGAVRHKHPFRHEAIFPENTKSSPPGSLSFLLISQLVGKQPGGLLHFLFSFLCDCGA